MIYIVNDGNYERARFTQATVGGEIIDNKTISDTLINLSDENHIFIKSGVFVKCKEKVDNYLTNPKEIGIEPDYVSAFRNEVENRFYSSVVFVPSCMVGSHFFKDVKDINDLINHMCRYEAKPIYRDELLFIPPISVMNNTNFNKYEYDTSVFVDLTSCFPDSPLPHGANIPIFASIFDDISSISEKVSEEFNDTITKNIMMSIGIDYVIHSVIDTQKSLKYTNQTLDKVMDYVEYLESRIKKLEG